MTPTGTPRAQPDPQAVPLQHRTAHGDPPASLNRAVTTTITAITISAITALGLAGAACTSKDDNTASQATTTPAAPTTPPGQRPAAGNPPPATGAAVDPKDRQAANQAIDTIRASLPYPPEVIDCIAERLATNPDLLGRSAGGISQGSPVQNEILGLGQECTQAVIFAPQFADMIQQQHNGKLNQEQLDCLQRAYRALPKDELQAIINAELTPTATNRDQQARKADQILATCGIPTTTR